MTRSTDWTAVHNFLASLNGLTATEAFANLRMDANGYGWNAATRNEIARGISRHFAAERKPTPIEAGPGWPNSGSAWGRP